MPSLARVSDIPRAQLAVYVAAAVAVVLVGARYLRETAGAPRPVAAAHGAGGSGGGGSGGVRLSSGGGPVVVQVAGAVRRPGVFRMRAGDRVDDAVRRAGGATARAELAGVNLAAKVEDGRQVIVPTRAQVAGAAAPAGTGAAPVAGSASPNGGPAIPLNLNTATAEQLDTLDGVGPATAQKILAYRQAHGGFRSVAELGQVPGIGEKRLAALRGHLRV